MKTNERYFKAVAADMRVTEDRGQTNYQAYATVWGLAYHKVLVISKGYGEISKSVLANTDANPLHKELRNTNISEYNDITKQ